MYLLTLRTIHSDAGISTPMLANIANSFAEEKRILFIDIRKNVNRHCPVCPHAGGRSRARHTRVLSQRFAACFRLLLFSWRKGLVYPRLH
jgi:hypothetical protein